MAKDGLNLGNDGANEGYWRVQIRSERTGRWVRMKGPVSFDTVHPNYGPISGVGTFEGGARAGVALIKVSGGKLDGKTIEVPASDFEDIKAIIPEDAPGLEEARQLDAADGIVVNAPNVVNADTEVENRAGTREMVPVVVRDLKVGDIVQQGTPDALFGRITRAYHSSDGETSQIDVTWSDGLSYTMGLTPTDMVKSWPSSSFLSKLPTKHSSTEEQIAAVQSYAHQGHSPINGYLRADAKLEDGTRFVYNAWGDDYPEQRVLDEIKQLDGLIENSPGLWGDTTLYRFIDSKRLSDEMRLLKPGALLFDKGYTSTARGYGWRYEGPNPDKVRMVISAPAGTKALDIQWFKRQSLSSSGESEVLLPRGTTFVVDKVEGHLVYVSIVPNKQTGIFREYGDVDKNAVENTPLSELGFDPEEEITIYRGVPAGITDINPGDWVTALPQLAKDYAGGDGEVISMKVKVKDLLSDPSAGEGGYTDEMIYRPAEVVDAPIEGWEGDGAVESRGESTILDSILTDEGFKVDGSPDKPLSAVDADVVRDDHAKAVDLYTRSSLWRSINSYLRGDLEEQESSKNIEDTIPLLDEAIAENGEVFEAGRVFRGQRIDRSQSGENWAKFMDGLEPGDVYIDDAYLSTSNSSLLAAREFGIGSYGTWKTIAEGTVTADAPGGNGSIFWAIDVPVGTTAFAVPDGMGYAQGAEREVILPRGSKFVIKGVRRVEQNKPDADPDAPKSYNYFVAAELLPVEVPKIVDAPIVEETEDWVEVDGVQFKGKSEIFDGILTGDEFKYGGLRRPVGMADSTNFTYEQQRALSNYTGSDFKDINDYLRTGELDEDSFYDEEIMKSELEEIDAAIAENGYVEEAATVFRGMKIKKSTVTDSGENFASVFEKLQVGDVYYEKSYLSASNSPAVAHHAFASGGLPDYFETTEDASNNAFEKGTAFWAINIPEGGTALALPVNDEDFEITGDEREEEVIIPRDSGLKIKAIRRVRQNRDDGEEAYNYYIEADLLPVRKPVETVTEEPEVVDAPPIQTWVEVDGVQKVGDAPLFDDGRLTDTEFEASDLGDLTPIPTDFSQTPDEQIKAVLAYTRDDYDFINSILRGESLHPKQQQRFDKLSKSIELIDKTFESQKPIKYGKTVFRGLIFYRPELAILFENLRPGDEWAEAAYLSTSGSPLSARGFSMMRDENPSAANASNHNIKEAQGTAFWAINLPEGSKALDLSEVSQYETEGEILLPRGSKLKIEGIRRVRQNRKDGAEYYNYYIEAGLVSEPVEIDAPIVEESDVGDIPSYKFENSKTGWKYSDDHIVGNSSDGPTDEELDAISTYVGKGYTQMNAALRGEGTGEDVLSEEEVTTSIETLANLIDRNPPLGTSALLYRGIYVPEDSEWSNLEVGEVIVDRGFVSTSPSAPTARGFGNLQLEIEVDENTKAIDVSETVEGTRVAVREPEVILQRGTNFEVVAKTENGYRLRVVGVSEPETVDADSVEETPATRTISTIADLVENYEELVNRIEEIENSSESKVEKGDVPMRALMEMMGKGGKPEMVDPSVLAGREIFYRGGPGFAIDSLKYSATDRIGLGVYGNGYYFSNLTDTAEIYSAMGPGGMDAGAVVSVVWKPTAKVYNIDDLDIKLPPGYNIKMYLYTIANEAKEGALKELNFPDKMTDSQRAIYKLFFSDQDVDAFTTTLILDGYDGLSFTFEGKHRVQEKYTIVFNREALQIADI